MFRSARNGASPEEWQSSVVGNLSQAGDAHRQAIDDIAGSIQTIRRTNAEHGRQRDAVHAQLSQKLRNTEELRQLLSTRIRAIRNNIEHTVWSHGKLKVALQSLVAPTDLCRQRMALRQKRPKRELIFDPFQEALLAEEKELQVAKSRLTDALTDTQALERGLQQTMAELEADLMDKQHALQIDSLCAHKKADETPGRKLDRIYNRKDQGLKPVFPEIQATPRGLGNGAEPEGRAQERNRQRATLKSIENAMRMEAEAKARWQMSSDVMDQVTKSTAQAFKQTQADMGAKIEHTELLRQELVKQRRVTEKKIEDLQKTLGMTSDKLVFIEKPMSANRQRTNIRNGRTSREATADEVSEALGCQQHALQAKKQQLQGQVGSCNASLRELEAAYNQLIDDINDKERSLAIDRSCASCKNTAHAHMSYGFAKVGQGQRHFSDTASSKLRQVPT